MLFDLGYTLPSPVIDSGNSGFLLITPVKVKFPLPQYLF